MKKVLFLIAFILLANPFFSYVDILPDFIAYILIMIALSKPTYYDEKALAAYKGARNMLLVSLVRFVCIYVATLELDSTLSLLFSFTFFALELVFGIPFIIKLYSYFSDRALKAENIKVLKIAEAFKIVTIVLFSIRLLLSTLPDFILLTAADPLSSYQNDFTSFRPMLVVFSVILSLPITCAWIPMETILITKLFTKEEARLHSELFEETVKHKSLQYKLKAYRRALVIIGVLSLLAFDFRLDNINIICSAVLPLVFIAIFLFFLLKKYIKFDKLVIALIPVSVLQLVFFIIEHIKTKAFFRKYTQESVIKVSQAETMYHAIIPLIVIGSILFCASVCLMLCIIIKNGKLVLEAHTKEVLPNTDFDYTVKDYQKRAKTMGIVTTIFLAISSTLSPIVFAIMPRIDEFTRIKIFDFETNLSLFQAFMPLQFLSTLAFIISFVSTLVVVHEGSYKKLYEGILLN